LAEIVEGIVVQGGGDEERLSPVGRKGLLERVERVECRPSH